MSTDIDWYFDFISPFAYLQQKRLACFPANTNIRPRPILFAGLLNHWGHKGPAEIPAKRIFTYRHAIWLGRRLGIKLRMPPAHPFAPLRPLRLAIAMQNDMEVIGKIFDFIWYEGLSVEDDADWYNFATRLDIDDVDALTSDPEVKNRLRENTEAAVHAGVFGVPTLFTGNELFWGYDATDMCLDYVNNPELFEEVEMKRIDTLPVTAQR